jgi:hypothetical protein
VDRAEKRELVTGLNDAFKGAGSVVVAHYAGITVAQMNDLRTKMRQAGGTVKVAKNRLAKIALQGTDSEKIIDLFKGQTLIARHAPLARRTARQAGRPSGRARDPDRPDRQCAGRSGRARHWRLCPEGRGGVTPFLAEHQQHVRTN